jgi:hypothetical protein
MNYLYSRGREFPLFHLQEGFIVGFGARVEGQFLQHLQ